MYRAKEAGRGRYELFDEGMRKRVLSRLRVENELRGAITRGALRVHYQPVVDAFTGRPEGVEALVRWEHEERGLLGPAEFIAVAEETGLITQLGRFVLEAATAQVAVWQRTYGPLELCVNVSGRQLANPQFPAEVAAIMGQSGMLPGTLGLEITESVLIEEAGSSVRVLTALQEHGMRLLLDDFGTGYSSLSYLKNFPLDALKLDRSFVDGLGVHSGDTAIVEAIVRMAHAVDMTVVAEGVETDEQLATLRRLGCGRAQGFLFAAPMTAPDFAAYLAARRGAAVA
jgi:EAL domain-containing protein (putative c-di-GMP-specific phosphodiesterase class I)